MTSGILKLLGRSLWGFSRHVRMMLTLPVVSMDHAGMPLAYMYWII